MSTPLAKRGMVLVHEEHHSDYIVGQGPQEYDSYTLGVVTSVTRAGLVKRFRALGWRGNSDQAGPGEPYWGFQGKVYLAPGVDVAAATTVARAHTWPGHPDQPMPFASLGGVREALRPYAAGHARSRAVTAATVGTGRTPAQIRRSRNLQARSGEHNHWSWWPRDAAGRWTDRCTGPRSHCQLHRNDRDWYDDQYGHARVREAPTAASMHSTHIETGDGLLRHKPLISLRHHQDAAVARRHRG